MRWYNWLDNTEIETTKETKPKPKEVRIKERKLPRSVEIISDPTAKLHWRIK